MYQLVNKLYIDGIIINLKLATNNWVSLNTFASITSTSLATLNSLLVNTTSIFNGVCNFNANTIFNATTTFNYLATMVSLSVTGDSNMHRINSLKNVYINTAHDSTRLTTPLYMRLNLSPAAYVSNGGGGSYPIFGSIPDFSTLFCDNIDDLYIVLPGYKLVIYLENNYTNVSAAMDNTTSAVIKYYTPNVANNASSCRLYYNDITLGLIEMTSITSSGIVTYA
jgi:hypothetical protein